MYEYKPGSWIGIQVLPAREKTEADHRYNLCLWSKYWAQIPREDLGIYIKQARINERIAALELENEALRRRAA